MKVPSLSFASMTKGIEIDDKVGLVITDPNVQKKYKGLLADIILQILRIPFGHHMSLKVKIFEPKSLMDRFLNCFDTINHYILSAADANVSPIERMKYVMTSIISCLYLTVQQLKPFNPFLFFSFQGKMPCGAKVYVEQVTHTPLASRIYIIYLRNLWLFVLFCPVGRAGKCHVRSAEGPLCV